MGYPIKSWNDVLNKRNNFEQNSKPEFYCFILYKTQHSEFRKYILENYNQLRSLSGNIDFYIIDKPYKWNEQQGMDYYYIAMGKGYLPSDLNDEEVDVVCDYFKIHPKLLPAVIAFPDLSSKRCNTFGLQSLSTYFEYDDFFKRLFNHSNVIVPRREKEMLLDVTNDIRRNLPRVFFQVAYFEDNRCIIWILEEISDTLRKIEKGIDKVLAKLEEIHNQIKLIKVQCSDRLKLLERLPDSNRKDNVVEEIHDQVDWQFLLKLKLLADDPQINSRYHRSPDLDNYEFLNCFEESSRRMIRSCMIVERSVTINKVNGFDYSLCAVGYWKAIEIELNITLIDAIRYMRNLIPEIPSKGVTLKEESYKIFTGYSRKNQEIRIDINRKIDSKLISLMLGQLINVAKCYERNDLLEVLHKYQLEEFNTLNEFMSEFIKQLSTIINKYRNKCSHTQQLNDSELKQLKQLLFSEKGFYPKIALMKLGIENLVINAQ